MTDLIGKCRFCFGKRTQNHSVFGIYRDGVLTGLFAFLVLPEEKYAEIIVGLSRDKEAYREMLRYLEQDLSAYQVDFVFNPNNHLLSEELKARGAVFEIEQQKMIWIGTAPA